MSDGMSRQINMNSIDNAEIVIIGNGIAGLTAALEARRLDPHKRIVVITEQNHPTINTPALKQFAIGKLTREQLLAYPAGTERAQRIHVVNARVEEIRAQSNYVNLTGGRGFGYGSLLITTGSKAKGLPQHLPGRDFDGVLTLHRLSDYLNLGRRLNETEEAVVIGGGPQAIETVVCMLYWGIRVHWLIRSNTFLPRMLDRPASDMVLERIQRAGAKVYTETEVIGIVGRVGSVAGVVTNQHQFLPCQLVLVCTGTTPVTSLATHCDVPMRYGRGILVDSQFRSSVPGIYAAGDVAALQDPQTGEFASRAQWYAAVLQGRVAAAAMSGSAPYEEGVGVRWHATRLGELSLLTVGNPIQWCDTATTLTDSSKGSYRRLSIVDDRLIGYLSLGPSQPDGLAIKRLIDEGHSIRDVKKALLKGDFDARKYFSHQRTYAAQYMVNTGKLLSPYAAEASPQTQPLTHSIRETGPLEAPDVTSTHCGVKIELSPDSSRSMSLYDSTSLHGNVEAARSGNLAPAEYTTTSLYVESNAIEKSAPLFFEEGFAPNRQEGGSAEALNAVESTIVPIPSHRPRRALGSLWSYRDRLSTVKAKRKMNQFVAPNPLDTSRHSIAGSTEQRLSTSAVTVTKVPEHFQADIKQSSSLWYYTDKQTAIKKGQ
jgi:NADPH-dependent 2,4-dienoyl-CoA reductase/sulfur reductase-like enzyme